MTKHYSAFYQYARRTEGEGAGGWVGPFLDWIFVFRPRVPPHDIFFGRLARVGGFNLDS